MWAIIAIIIVSIFYTTILWIITITYHRKLILQRRQQQQQHHHQQHQQQHYDYLDIRYNSDDNDDNDNVEEETSENDEILLDDDNEDENDGIELTTMVRRSSRNTLRPPPPPTANATTTDQEEEEELVAVVNESISQIPCCLSILYMISIISLGIPPMMITISLYNTRSFLNPYSSSSGCTSNNLQYYEWKKQQDNKQPLPSFIQDWYERTTDETSYNYASNQYYFCQLNHLQCKSSNLKSLLKSLHAFVHALYGQVVVGPPGSGKTTMTARMRKRAGPRRANATTRSST